MKFSPVSFATNTLAVAFAFVSTATTVVVNAQNNDIPTTAVNAGIFDTLVAALDAADLVDAISSPNGPFTVFAPTDDAFDALPDGLVGCLLQDDNKQALTDILLYHVASGEVLSTDLTDGMEIPTLLQGQDVTVDLRNSGAVNINDSNVVSADVLASNGVIHIIDQVLVPSSIDVTAFLETCGGDSSLVDIPTTAVNANIFNTLVAALDAADLVDAISDPNGPFTVFAPTDDAFAALPDGLVGCLLEEDNKQALTDILLYHVASGEVLSTNLSDNQNIPTLLTGDEVTVNIRSSDGRVKINDSKVIGADVLASNGVIHIIDAVLVPPSIDVTAFFETCGGGLSLVDIPTTAVNANIFNTLVAALDAADLVGAISDPNGPFTVFAPTDDAFAALPDGVVGCLLEEDNKQALTDILLYHVASGAVLSTDLSDNQNIQTLLTGGEVTVDIRSSDGRVKINDSKVIGADVLASNGVIHIINQVLVPSSIDVLAFLETCGGPFDDDDDETSSVVDIPTTAVNANIFNTLVAALDAADLVGAISDPNGPFTVFAPTDDAFDALPDGLVGCLLQVDNKQALTDVLLYHVASGKVLSTDLSDNQKIPTLLTGGEVTVDIRSNGGVKINESTVISADVLASNGVIHVIDAVLVPEGRLDNLSCDGGDDCIYEGVPRSAGQYLTGPTHTCLCTTGGHWIQCRPNTDTENVDSKNLNTGTDSNESTGQFVTESDISSSSSLSFYSVSFYISFLSAFIFLKVSN